MPKKALLPATHDRSVAFWIALLILFILPAYYIRFSFGPLPTNIIEVAIGLFVVLVVGEIFKQKTRLVLPYVKPILCILVGIVIGVFVAEDMRVALGILKGWFLLPLLFAWGLSITLKPSYIRPLLFTLYGNVVLVGMYAILQRYGIIPLVGHQVTNGDLLQYVEQGRALGFFESPNYLAMYLTPLVLFLGLYLLMDRDIKAKWWWGIGLLIPLLGIYLSASRAAFITLFLFGLPMAWFFIRERGKKMTYALAPLAILAVVILLLKVKVNLGGVDSLRFGIWQTALTLINEHPLTGIGPGQFLDAFGANPYGLQQPLFVAALPFALHPHSLYMNMWLSGGLLGFVGLIWLLFILGKDFHTAQQPRNALLIASYGTFLSFFIQGFFDSTYFKNDLSIIFWLIVALFFFAKQTQNEVQAPFVWKK